MTAQAAEATDLTAAARPRGTDPFISTGEPITIEGVEYEIRRMGLRDMFRIAEILRNIIANGTMQFGMWMGSVRMDPSAMYASILTLGLAGAEEPTLSLLASLMRPVGTRDMPLTVKEISDPSRFPIYSCLEIVEKMSIHPDIKAFFSNWEKKKSLLSSLLPKKDASNGSSGAAATDSPEA